jgi:tetratricopeptide (TPR) repeat protein
MKIPFRLKRSVILLSFLSITAAASYGQKRFTAEQYQQDLLFLQKTVHEEYPFLFKKTTAADFDKEVSELFVNIPQMEDHEVLVGLAKLVASFEYGHTVLGYWENVIPIHQLPIVLYQYDDGVFLQGVQKDYVEALGTRLMAINGMPIEEVMKRMRPVVPAENDQFVKAYGLHYLTFPEFLHAQGVLQEMTASVTLTLKKEGKTFEKEVKAMPMERFPRQYGMVIPGEDWLESRDLSETPLYLKDLERIYRYEYLPEHKALYVRQSQIMDDSIQTIPEFYREVFDFIEKNDVEKLILDVRLNGGGNNYKNKPVVTGIIANKKINQSGKFFVILGRRTFSACQNLVNELHTYTNAVFIGEPTSENINFYGDTRPVNLPNTKLNAYLSFAWWQDKPQWENKPALYPQIATGLTFEQYRTNQDPALEAALAFTSEKFITDPMGYFIELFTSGQVDKILPEAQRMLKDPAYAFFDFEGEFNTAGFNLLAQESYMEAVYVLQINTALFPNSAKAWDSLAEAYWKSGNPEKAVEYYTKALSLDADGPTGENARLQIRKLQTPEVKD